jgi:hypothetical protein
LPGLPIVGLPRRSKRANAAFKALASIFNTLATTSAKEKPLWAICGPLNRRASIAFTDPNFKWTSGRPVLPDPEER